MTKSPARSSPARTNSVQRKAQEYEEKRIMEIFDDQPELCDFMNTIFTSGRKKQQASWEDLAKNLECDVELLKKVALKVRQNGEMQKKSKESTPEPRPRSARAGSSEPKDAAPTSKESRRSLRSQIMEKNISSAQTSEQSESANTSCASSTCSSPRPEEKPEKRPQQRASRRLSSINEKTTTAIVHTADISTTTATDDIKPSKIVEKENQQSSPITISEDDPGEQVLARSSAMVHDTATPAGDAKPTRTLRFTEPRDKQSSATTNGNPNRRLIVMSSSTNKNQQEQHLPRHEKKIMTNSNNHDSTRIFFDSMAMTVMSFPVHIQASVKARVARMIYDYEIELSSPENGADFSEKSTIECA